jgi:hypothetical protein
MPQFLTFRPVLLSRSNYRIHSLNKTLKYQHLHIIRLNRNTNLNFDDLVSKCSSKWYFLKHI